LRHRTQGVMTQFGAAPAALMPGARNAVETCLTIQAGERVALVSDAVSAPVAACLASALSDAGARWTGYLIEDLAPRPLADVPPAIADALEAADAGILCAQPLEGELRARMAIVSIVERRQIRYAHMVGVTPEIMQQGMVADYRLVDRLSDRLLAWMRSARRLKVRT